MEEISKKQMQLAIKRLERLAAKIEDVVPTFRGIPVAAFEKEHLLMLCIVFANEWRKANAKYLQASDKLFPSYFAGANAVCEALYKPTLWRRIWNRIKKWA